MDIASTISGVQGFFAGAVEKVMNVTNMFFGSFNPQGIQHIFGLIMNGQFEQAMNIITNNYRGQTYDYLSNPQLFADRFSGGEINPEYDEIRQHLLDNFDSLTFSDNFFHDFVGTMANGRNEHISLASLVLSSPELISGLDYEGKSLLIDNLVAEMHKTQDISKLVKLTQIIEENREDIINTVDISEISTALRNLGVEEFDEQALKGFIFDSYANSRVPTAQMFVLMEGIEINDLGEAPTFVQEETILRIEQEVESEAFGSSITLNEEEIQAEIQRRFVEEFRIYQAQEEQYQQLSRIKAIQGLSLEYPEFFQKYDAYEFLLTGNSGSIANTSLITGLKDELSAMPYSPEKTIGLAYIHFVESKSSEVTDPEYYRSAHTMIQQMQAMGMGLEEINSAIIGDNLISIDIKEQANAGTEQSVEIFAEGNYTLTTNLPSEAINTLLSQNYENGVVINENGRINFKSQSELQAIIKIFVENGIDPEMWIDVPNTNQPVDFVANIANEKLLVFPAEIEEDILPPAQTTNTETLLQSQMR